MFEATFPVDKASCSYHVLWNSFKKIAAGASPADKAGALSRYGGTCCIGSMYNV